MKDEIWKDIPGYEGMYRVSNFGNVHSHYRNRLLKKYIDKNNYLRTCITKNKKSKLIYIHRLVASAFIPNPENKRFINHLDFNPLNNHVENIQWVTHAENVGYSKQHKRFKMSEERKEIQRLINSGENNPRTKLLNSDIPVIIKLKKTGLYDREIAKLYDVNRRVINNILNKKSFQSI